MNKLLVHPFQTGFLPIHRPERNGKLGSAMWDSGFESVLGALETRFLRLRYSRSYTLRKGHRSGASGNGFL